MNRHDSAGSDMISCSVRITRRIARISTPNKASRDWRYSPRIPTGVLRVAIRLGEHAACIAACRRANVVTRRVVRAAKPVSTTS
jgi:hypothetical protein